MESFANSPQRSQILQALAEEGKSEADFVHEISGGDAEQFLAIAESIYDAKGRDLCEAYIRAYWGKLPADKQAAVAAMLFTALRKLEVGR